MASEQQKTIGKYEIIAELGRGAMGEVYKARDPLIGRMVALKVITSGLAGKPELLERFYQEARSAGALQHPNIVTVYELGKEGDLPFIAMEYLGGDSLEKIIARQAPMPLAQKVGYVVQICRALEYAHKHGVVHRDVKPANIMLNSEGQVKVVDFGIARLVDASKTQTGTLIGTLGYMSPQQLRGEHADERSDIWAVGVLFFELLACQRPFQGDNPAALMMSIISKEPPALAELAPDCTSDVEAIVSRMLQKDALARYQSMDEALLDLDSVWKRLQQARVSDLVQESQRLFEANDLKRAQELLREALHADSSRWEAKTLLETVSRELRRQQLLPRVKEQVAKAQGFLEAGQLQEAKAEAQAALQLDSTYTPAQELLSSVEQAVERVREMDKKLRVSKQRIAEGALTDAELQLGEVLTLDPHNDQAQQLLQQVRDEVSRREKRKQASEGVRHARDLWSRQQYQECVAELTGLQAEFPGDTEIAKLLDTARRDEAEQEKQKKLSEARNLLASQQYEAARTALAALEKDFPQDTAVLNLLHLAEDERTVEERKQRLRGEIASLRALVNEGKHAEAGRRGEALLKEFPGEFELDELVKFAQAEARRGEQAKRLEDGIRRARKFAEQGGYGDAIRTAEKLLNEFPGNADLLVLCEDAREKQKEKERRRQIEQRIREVRGKLDRKDVTGAIELARETIASLGPDTDIGQLLEVASRERSERAREKQQEQKFVDARTLLADGRVDEAAAVVSDGVATQLLDAGDPRVKALLEEVEKKKESGAVPVASAPVAEQPAPAAPATPEPPTAESPAAASAPVEPPQPAPPSVKPPAAVPEPPKSEAKAAAPAPAKPESKPEPKPEQKAQPSRKPEPPKKTEPAKPKQAPAPVVEKAKKETEAAPALAETKAKVAPTPAPAQPSRSKAPWIAAAVIAVAAAAGAAYYFSTRPSTPSVANAPQPAAGSSTTPSASPAAPSAPVNSLERQQRALMDQAQKLVGQGKFSDALKQADGAIALNGPLTTDARSLRAEIVKAQSNKAAQASLEKEGRLWTAAMAAYRGDRLDAAERDFRQVAGIAGGSHQAEAQNYVNTVIPQARKSDALFRQAETLSRQRNNPGSLQQANQDLQQVIASGGPRARDAARLESSLASDLGASDQLKALVAQYNAGTDHMSDLEKLQAQFRSLERYGGTVGHSAYLYAERRIPQEMKELQSTEATSASAAAPSTPAAGAAPQQSAAPTQRLLWAVEVDANAAPTHWQGSLTPGQMVGEQYVDGGMRIVSHPLPVAVVAAAAAKNSQFELEFTVNGQGRITGGRVLSGTPSLGQTVVSEAEKGWRFNAPTVNGKAVETQVRVSVQF